LPSLRDALALLHRHALGEVARLVDVGALGRTMTAPNTAGPPAFASHFRLIADWQGPVGLLAGAAIGLAGARFALLSLGEPCSEMARQTARGVVGTKGKSH